VLHMKLGLPTVPDSPRPSRNWLAASRVPNRVDFFAKLFLQSSTIQYNTIRDAILTCARVETSCNCCIQITVAHRAHRGGGGLKHSRGGGVEKVGGG